MYQFKDKVALVTGGGSGIGRSTAYLYARDGAKVVVADWNENAGKETADCIESDGGEAIFVKVNVAEPADCQMMVEQALHHYGRLDFACNNAGIGGEQNPTADYSVEGWLQVIDINLNGVFYCMKFEIPAMLKHGGGAIVNIGSILSQVAFATSPAYVAAKHGLIGLTQYAAVEYATDGIRVNTIGPAFIHTPLLASLEQNPDVMNMLLALHPMGRLGQPEEVAELVMWLSSEKASFVTGGYYPVDGGYLAR